MLRRITIRGFVVMYTRKINLTLGADGQIVVLLEVSFTTRRYPASWDDPGDFEVEVVEYAIEEVASTGYKGDEYVDVWPADFVTRYQADLEVFIDRERESIEELCADAI